MGAASCAICSIKDSIFKKKRLVLQEATICLILPSLLPPYRYFTPPKCHSASNCFGKQELRNICPSTAGTKPEGRKKNRESERIKYNTAVDQRIEIEKTERSSLRLSSKSKEIWIDISPWTMNWIKLPLWIKVLSQSGKVVLILSCKLQSS